MSGTPGPWILYGQRDGKEWHAHAILPAGRPGQVVDFAAPPSEADAKLMAAAPELFEALEDLLLEVEEGRRPMSGFIARAKSAIAKASPPPLSMEKEK